MVEEQETPLETPSEQKIEEDSNSVEEVVCEGEVEKAVKRRGHTHISFQGPLPPPEILQRYKDIQPDFPERILRLTEEEAAHRRDITRKAVWIDGIETIIGQIFGLVVALAAFITTNVLGYFGHPAAASIVGSSTIVGLVAVFIKGRSQPPSDDKNTD